MKQTKTLWMALVALLAIGFSSCNDEIADYKNDLKTFRETLVDNTKDLQDKVDDLKAALDTADLNHATYEYVDAADQKLQVQLDSMKLALANHQTSIDELLGRMTAVETVAADAAAAAAAAQATATAAQTQAGINTVAIAALTAWQTATEIWKAGVNADLDTTRYNASYALALAKMDSIRIDQLEDTLANFVTRPELIDSLNSYLEQANAYADSLHTIAMDSLRDLANHIDLHCDSLRIIDAAYQHADSLLQDSIDALAARVDLILAQVLENTRRIDSLCLEMDTVKNRLDNIEDHLDRTIYSLAAQGTVNTVFGYAAIPGYALNILIGYYGQAGDQGVKFPTYRTANLVPAAAILTQAEATAAGLALEGFTAAGQETLVAEGSNAGKIYFQLNPAQANLDATNFQLVKSNGNACAINIDSVKASEDELTFGVSFNGRSNAALTGAQSANGFYEMYTSIDESNINALKITIDENLKSTAKNMLEKGIRNISGADLTALAKAMYDQMNGFLPAYALQATWTDSLGEHTVNSNYDIAATAVKPLSFGFLSDVNFPNIRKINPLDEVNFSLPTFNFNFDTIKVDTTDITFTFNIVFDTIKIDTYGDIIAKVKVPAKYHMDTDPMSPTFGEVTPDAIDVNDPSTYILYDIDLKDYQVWAEKLAHDINQKVSDLGANIEDQVQTQMVAKLRKELNKMIVSFQTEMNKMLANISGELTSNVNSAMNDAANDINSKLNNYLGKVNSLINRMNSLIDKVNNRLKSPNQFLQPVLLYNGKDGGVHFMSQNPVLPTVFNGNGAIKLFPTSYTAEIVAPAYKKYVAVVDVYTATASAQGGDAACMSALNAANSGEYFNTVLDGGRYGIVGTFQAGYTYKILYSAVDYHGKIAQKFYYVTVK